MVNPRILCIIPVRLGEEFYGVLKSVLEQTVKVDYVLLTFKKGPNVSNFAQKMSSVMNDALCKVRLKEFDYLFRVDVDVRLPPNFLERNLEGEPDYCGPAAFSQIIKVAAFYKVLNGQFPLFSDDSYVTRKFKIEGSRIRQDYVIHPIKIRASGSSHDSKYFIHRGLEQYRLGYTPIHSFLNSIRTIAKIRQLNGIFIVFAYFVGWLFRIKKRDVYALTHRRQIERLRKFFGGVYGETFA